MNLYTRYNKIGLLKSLENFPVAAVIGPRQCGKSTLVKQLLEEKPTKELEECIYLDLERPSDLVKLENTEWFFNANKGKQKMVPGTFDRNTAI